MTGREKMEAAFSTEGAREIPATICYATIYTRDHWAELTDCPWWYRYSPKMEDQLAWRRDLLKQTGCDWINIKPRHPREERKRQEILIRGDDVFLMDQDSGEEKQLPPPVVGGPHSSSARDRKGDLDHLPASEADLDAVLPESELLDVEAFREDVRKSGYADLTGAIIRELDVLPIWHHVGSPLWCTYDLWGYEGMMVMIATRPDLVRTAARRFLGNAIHSVHRAAALGAKTVWIEEALTDQISPADFAKLNVPLMGALCEAIRACGMWSIYYYCGGPEDRLDPILEVGADALSFEESKKNFSIDIEEIAEIVNGRCVLLGNLDAIGILQDGTEDALKTEIKRQLMAGRRNKSRFIMSTGSPPTPGTPVERVRLYHDLVHELGS